MLLAVQPFEEPVSAIYDVTSAAPIVLRHSSSCRSAEMDEHFGCLAFWICRLSLMTPWVYILNFAALQWPPMADEVPRWPERSIR